MKMAARIPAVKALVEVTLKGLNQEPETWIAVAGGFDP